MSEPEDHVEVSPLHKLEVDMKARLESNEIHAERHPDPNVRRDAAARAEVYRLVVSEVLRAIATAAKDNVDRVLAQRIKQQVVATAASIKAQKVVVE